jgi:hypothetical protein
MDELHQLYLQADKLIEEHRSNDFINFFNDNIEDMKKIKHRLPQLYRESCYKGNVVIVDFLLNCPLNNLINYDFPYVESDPPHQEEIPNGAIFLAFDNHHFDLVEYFVKNDIYYINSETIEGLETYMSSAVEQLRKIEEKVYLDETLSKQPEKKKNIKI